MTTGLFLSTSKHAALNSLFIISISQNIDEVASFYDGNGIRNASSSSII